MRFIISLSLIATLFSVPSWAADKQEIDAYVEEALSEFYQHSPAGKKLAQRAKGILVFPRVYKAGFGIGGEYGEGKLIAGGATKGYYSVSAASVGFQLGVQRKSQILLFMTSEALNNFLSSEGWDAGVDGSVAIASLGAGGEIDTKTANQPVIAFIFSNKGLMYNLTLEGSKITQIVR
jgi:lipid-binding SYLF domain-containing protein